MNLGRINSLWSRHAGEVRPRLASPVLQASEAPPATPLRSNQGRRFIARQTIFDLSRNIYGYELLSRSGWENSFSGDTDLATRVMIADGTLYGFHDLTHGMPAFLNCSREALVNDLVTLLPNSTVIEILETVVGDAEVLEACARYKSLGYRLALDDFRLADRMDGLLSLADYVKVDFRLSDSDERKDILNALRPYDLTLIAEKIETEQEFHEALAEGFTLFQGYFFCRPTVFSKKRAPASGANYLSLLAAMSQCDSHLAELARLLRTEVALSYQLLRLVNAAGYGMGHTIDSLEHALLVVGERQFAKLLLNAIATDICSDRSSELLVHVLHRARFLELLAPLICENPPEQYLIGIISGIDAMLDAPSTNFVRALPLREEVRKALQGTKNGVGAGLRLFESYRNTDWSACMEISSELRVTENDVTHTYCRALLWAELCEGRGCMERQTNTSGTFAEMPCAE